MLGTQRIARCWLRRLVLPHRLKLPTELARLDFKAAFKLEHSYGLAAKAGPLLEQHDALCDMLAALALEVKQAVAVERDIETKVRRCPVAACCWRGVHGRQTAGVLSHVPTPPTDVRRLCRAPLCLHKQTGLRHGRGARVRQRGLCGCRQELPAGAGRLARVDFGRERRQRDAHVSARVPQPDGGRGPV